MKDCKRLTATAAAALLLASGNAMASGSSAGFYYADFGDLGDGFGVEGSFMLGENARLFGDLTFVDEGSFELDIVRIGGGFVIPMDETMSMEVGGSFQQWDFSTLFGSFDDNAFGLHGIFNFSPTPQFHLQAKLEYLMFDDIDDDDIVLGFRGTFDISREFSVFGGVEIYNHDFLDDTMLKIGASFNF
jgi:hypothetical protein